jgi:8-oxo-dGTP pyrophosphatase MutT (NUDIX family)
VLIPNDGLFLAVSRRNDTTRWGLPGGKVDPDESSLQAIRREVQEETGLELWPSLLEPLFVAVCPGKGADDTYWVTTYLWVGAAPTEADMKAEDGLVLRWLPEAALTDRTVSPFASYNKGVFNAWRMFSA